MQPYYYRSSRLNPGADKSKTAQKKRAPATESRRSKRWPRHIWALIILIVAAVLVLNYAGPLKSHVASTGAKLSAAATATKKKSAPVPTVATAPTPNACAGNTLSQEVIVSISARHLWACSASQQVYDSPVITGIEYLAADTTPLGTYHIYAKETDVTLRGSDSTGSWDDYVYYWMPFLDNQYGAYGFHDATWRAATAFGNISPDSADASHGCVECPLATAQWLYSWVQVGTTVSIIS